MTIKIKFGLSAIIIFSFCIQVQAIETSYLKGRKIDRFYLSGDFGFRVQGEADNGADNKNNERIAVKLGVGTELDEQLSMLIEGATANSSRSTRLTLGDQKEPGSPRRSFGLQKAFMDWRPGDWISIKVGRTPQVHQTVGESEILFDNTIALEGASVELQEKFDGWEVDLQGGSHFVRENYDSYYSVEQSDVMINWGQISLHAEHFSLGAGFFNFAAIQGTAYNDLYIGSGPAGNSESPAGVVKDRFVPKQIFAETRWGRWSLFAEGIKNDDTKDPNKAYWVGTAWKNEKWSAQLAYGEIDSDAVPSFVTSTQFGDGNTDSKGWALTAGWKVSPKMSVELNQYWNRLKKSSDNTQYLLTQIDTKIVF